jgi:hypothetical protein
MGMARIHSSAAVTVAIANVLSSKAVSTATRHRVVCYASGINARTGRVALNRADRRDSVKKQPPWYRAFDKHTS